VPELSHALVTGGSATPDRWMLFLHGILGTGSNWRTFARQWVEQHPSWGAVLVDLRLHGGSVGFGPPHTLAACADDLRALRPKIPGRVAGVLGHSFGGKVALEYLGGGPDVEIAFVIDSTPSARPEGRGSESTVRIVSLLERLPAVFPTREAFIEEIERAGNDRAIAMWLAMQVKPARSGSGYEWRIDLAGVRALLDDYFCRDLWGVLERTPARVQLVIGGRSTVLDASDRARAARLAEERSGLVVHTLPEAGHWVHVDAPQALFEIVSHATPR